MFLEADLVSSYKTRQKVWNYYCFNNFCALVDFSTGKMILYINVEMQIKYENNAYSLVKDNVNTFYLSVCDTLVK